MNLKKLFATTLTVLMVATMFPVNVLKAGYSADLEDAYNYAFENEATTMASIDEANVYGQLTRSNMAKMLSNRGEKVLGLTPDTSKTCEFTDVANVSEELQGYIKTSCELGLMGVGVTKFRPNDKVSRAEFGTVLSRALRGDKNNGATPYYADHLAALEDAGIMTDISNPSMTEVRGYVWMMMKRAEDKGVATPSTCKDPMVAIACALNQTDAACPVECRDTVVDEVKAGSLNVDLNSSSATDGTQIPANGTIRFAVVDFKANSNDVSLQTVSIKKVGLATIPSTTRVWFEKDGIRVSGKAAFTSDGTAVLSFAPVYVVKAGDTESLDLYVQLTSSSYGDDFQFASTDVTSSAESVNGDFTTAKLRTANYTVAPVGVDMASTGGTFNVQADPQELGAFKLTNNYTGSDTRDIEFQSITLRQNGNGDLTNLDNVVLMKNGNIVSKDPITNGKDLTFSVGDTIKQGSSATYYIKAVVNNVDLTAGDSYQFNIRNTSDVNASETTSSAFRSTVTLTAGASTLNFGTYTIKGANINFTKDSNVDLSTNYAAGSDNVILMQGTITTKTPITLEDINHLNFTTTTGVERLFTTIYLKIGNSIFSYSPTAGNTGAQFLGTVTINSSATVKMYGKLRDTAPAATIKFDDLNFNSFTRKEYVGNSNAVAGAVGSIAGVSVTVQNATLNITKSDALGDTSIAQGMKGLLVYGVTLTSDQGNGATVSNLVLNVTSNNTALLYNNAYATLFINGVAKQSKTVDAATLTFDSFSKDVTKNNPVTMEVKVDFADAYNSGTFQLGLNDISAVDTLTSNPVSHTTPLGAKFTIAAAGAAIASSDNNPQAQLFLSPSTANKIVAFKMTANNDNVRLYDVNFTGNNLGGLSNFKLMDSAGNKVADATTASSTAVTFTQISNSIAVLKDKSETYYLVADVNSNTETSSIYANVSSINIKSSNGTVVAAAGTVTSRLHATSQNIMVAAYATNPGKLLTTSALRFTITASGKNSVTLTGLDLSTMVAGYTGGTRLAIYKNSVAEGNLAGTGAITATHINLSANNTVDAGTTPVTYIVALEGLVSDAGAYSHDWSVSLTNINFGGYLANAYYNVGAFPITEVK